LLLSAAICSASTVGSSQANWVPDLGNTTLFKRTVQLSTETVSDNVAYSPNLDQGGFATPKERARYQSYRLAYSFRHSGNSLVSISLSERQIYNLRDSFTINKAGFERFFRMTPSTSKFSLDLAFGASFSNADRIDKNSYTSFGENLITGSAIEKPRDRALSFNVIGGMKFGTQLTLSTFAGGGVVRTSHESINGKGQSGEGCEYEFSANGAGGNLTQIGSCNALLNYQQIYASEEDVGERLGFRPTQDIAYTGRFAESGVQIRWSSRKFGVSAGYRYRYYLRNIIDENIEASGNTSVTSSQTVHAEFSYKPSAQWQLSLAAKYQTAPFLDDLPMLYTAFTSDRYDNESSLSFQLGISWMFERLGPI